MRSILFAAILILLLLVPTRTVWAKDILNGTWAITVTPDDASAGNAYDDTLTFAAGKFTSKICQERGFAAATYQDDARGVSAERFSVDVSNEKQGKISWQGTATGNTIDGTCTWTQKDSSAVSYHFSGNKK